MSGNLQGRDELMTRLGEAGHERMSKTAGDRRSQRVVTFVTDAELEVLEEIASRSDRSLSFVVHRMIAAQLRSIARSRTGARDDPSDMSRHEPWDEGR